MVLNNKSIFEIFRVCVNRTGIKKPKEHCTDDDMIRFSRDEIPPVIQDVIIHLARSCVAIGDLFRRSGNTVLVEIYLRHAKRQLMTLHSENNSQVARNQDATNDPSEDDWKTCNAYTLANIVKRYLLQIKEGIFGREAEEKLIESLQLDDDQLRIERMSGIIVSLPDNTRKLLALLFGTWFRMIYHSDVNAMSVEAVAKSVAGSVLPSCTTDPKMVEKASSVMQQLIKGFPSAELFGKDLIQYYTSTTGTSISRIEKYRYEFIFPKNVSKKKSTRLFVRMLLDESAKHEFDVERDEVRKDEFDQIHNSVTIDDVNNNRQSNMSSSSHRSNRPPSTSQINSLPNERPPSGHVNAEKETDEVQQTLEKRTCVKALEKKPEKEFDSTQINQDSHTERNQLWKEMDDEMKLELQVQRDNPVTLLSDSSGDNTPAGASQSTTPVRERPDNSVCVQELMRKRLQKRSDWFLSPPSGCVNHTLMQLSPTIDAADSENTPPKVPTSTNQSNPLEQHQNEPSCDTIPEDDESIVRYFVIRKIYGPDTYRAVSITRM